MGRALSHADLVGLRAAQPAGHSGRCTGRRTLESASPRVRTAAGAPHDRTADGLVTLRLDHDPGGDGRAARPDTVGVKRSRSRTGVSSRSMRTRPASISIRPERRNSPRLHGQVVLAVADVAARSLPSTAAYPEASIAGGLRRADL